MGVGAELVVGVLVGLELENALVKVLDGPRTVTVVAPPLSPSGVDDA